MPTMKKLIVLMLLVLSPMSWADDTPAVQPVEESKSSPWLITPLLSSDPKLSTSVGALAGYVHEFDNESPPSLLGLFGTYSTTDSYYYGAFAQTFSGKDKHRTTLAVMAGVVRNDYADFAGSGLDVQTTDDLHLFAARYAYRFFGHWYFGPQLISANYAISGGNAFSEEVLKAVGLTGFDSNGLGLVAQYDTRDNQYSPSSGQAFEAYNIAYREEFGGDASFDVFSADYQYYLPHGERHVLAVRTAGTWSLDAPPGGYPSVDLRGYTAGQYIAENMILAELDERFSLTEKFGVTASAGLAYLYGDGSGEGKESLYPAGAIGSYYQLNDEKMVVRADFAMGKEGNYGFYLQFGQPF